MKLIEIKYNYEDRHLVTEWLLKNAYGQHLHYYWKNIIIFYNEVDASSFLLKFNGTQLENLLAQKMKALDGTS